ncbi:hypothetical protein ACFLYF_00840 [Chloroflexota bacterium]
MAADEATPNNSESETTKELPTEDDKKSMSIVEKDEEAIEKNPDAEDPRLFSPLQEPGRPARHERIAEKESDSENSST